MFEDLESESFKNTGICDDPAYRHIDSTYFESNRDILEASKVAMDDKVIPIKRKEIKELSRDPYMIVREIVKRTSRNPIEQEIELKKLSVKHGFSMTAIRDTVKEIRNEGNDKPLIRSEANKDKVKLSDLQFGEGLLLTEKGEIRDCIGNLVDIFTHHHNWKGRIKKNLLTDTTEVNGKSVTDNELTRIISVLKQDLRMQANHLNHVLAAVNLVGAENCYHPVTEWLDLLPEWDRTPRIDTLFSDFLGAEKSAYSSYVARIMLCSLLARAYNPGCIVRTVPILEGPEEIGKSRFVRELAYPWGGEISSNVESGKQIMEDIRGLWLAELMEMDTLRGAAASRIKAFITQRTDRYRKAYGRLSEDHPRVTVFIGTINPNQAINQFSDDDKNTRFLPLVCTCYESDGFLAARDQIFAEAKVWFSLHQTDWWVQPDDAMDPVQHLREERTVQDPWTNLVSNYLLTRSEVKIDGIFDSLEIPVKDRTRGLSTRVGVIMKKLGWVIAGSDYAQGRRERIYIKG